MKISRCLLKIKSRLYFQILVFLGTLSMISFTRCSSPVATDNTQHINDSIAKAKAFQDSVAKADSTAQAMKEKAFQDSIALADSIAKARKPKPNPYKPGPPTCKYGIDYNPN